MSSPDRRDHRRGHRILIVGTGGQGVLTAAKLLCECFVERGHEVVSGQLHGMAQRGGAVQSSVMIDAGISPVVRSGGADFVVGLEPVETARALPLMSARTAVFMNTAPVIPFVLAQRTVLEREGATYPDVDELIRSIRAVTEHVLALDATQRATEAGSAKALNMVMLGCLLGAGGMPCAADEFLESAAGRFPGALRETNLGAFGKGVEAVRSVVLGNAAR